MKQTMLALTLLLGTFLLLNAQPPHAKAHGKKKHGATYGSKHGNHFYYYPQHNVYYHPAGKKYACYQRGQWVWVATPPPGLVLRTANRHEFFYDGFDVWAYEPVRRQRRPTVQIQVNL